MQKKKLSKVVGESGGKLVSAALKKVTQPDFAKVKTPRPRSSTKIPRLQQNQHDYAVAVVYNNLITAKKYDSEQFLVSLALFRAICTQTFFLGEKHWLFALAHLADKRCA